MIFTTRNGIKKIEKIAIGKAKALYIQLCEERDACHVEPTSAIANLDLDLLGVLVLKECKSEIHPMLLTKLSEVARAALVADAFDRGGIWLDFLKGVEEAIAKSREAKKISELVSDILEELEDLGIVKIGDLSSQAATELLESDRGMKLREDICLVAIEVGQAEAIENGDDLDRLGLQGTPEQIFGRMGNGAVHEFGRFAQMGPDHQYPSTLDQLELTLKVVQKIQESITYLSSLVEVA